MKINGNAIRPGNVIEHKDRLWVAVKIQHTQPGKGGAYLQVELKDLRDGTKLNERFRSSETVERVRLDQKEHQYLYAEDGSYTFMDTESYEGSPLGVALPEHVTMEVVEADPVVKGQTAASSYKPAQMDNGMRVMVPPHIETGMRIVVATADGTYVERAKD